MRDPQLRDGEQVAWVVRWGRSSYVSLRPGDQSLHSTDIGPCDDPNEALCLAREADAKALAAFLRAYPVRDPERRVVKSEI